MSRLRTIKPGFFLDEELAECDPLARILFAGLWVIADREGRLEDRPRRIKAEVLPYDECDVDYLLDALEGIGCIVRYEVDGGRFIAIPTWHEHQQPHYKEALSVLPPPPGESDSTYKARPVGREQRDRILKRDGFRCCSCGSKSDLTIDHITPRSLGGDSSDDNLQVLCRKCNSAKNNRTASQARTDVGPTSADGSQDQPRSSCLVSCLVSCLGSGNLETEEPLVDSASESTRVEDADELVEGEIVSPTDEGFDAFWFLYPHKQGKVPARRAWGRLSRHDRKEATEIARAMAYCVECGYRDRDKCPHGSTFLHQRRWEEWRDEDGEFRAPPGYGPSNGHDRGARIEAIAVRWAAEHEGGAS